MPSSRSPGRVRLAEGQARRGPALRLLRLWLFAAPLAMLGLAATFAALAVGDGRWGLLATMVVLAIAAVGLFIAQAWLLRRYGEGQRIAKGRG